MLENLAGFVKLIGISIILILLWVILSYFAGDSFLEAGNLTNLMRRVSIFSILGIGVAMVIMIGGIDLSLGSVVCLTACCLAMFLQVDYQPYENFAVYEISKSNSEIVVQHSDRFAEGQLIRLYQAERNRSSTFSIEAIEPATQSNQDRLTLSGGRLQRDVGPANGAVVGRVAIATALASPTNQDPANKDITPGTFTVSVENSPNTLASRDQAWLLKDDGTYKSNTINTVTNKDGLIVVQLDSESTFDDSKWHWIPLQRQQRMSVPVAIGLSVLVATALGLLHGILVTGLRLQPFVVTLCGLLAYRGIARWLSSDQSVGFGSEYVDSLNWFSMGKVAVNLPIGEGFELGFPYAFFVFIFIAVCAMILMNYTIWGRYMLALGSNEEATRLSGVNTSRVKLMAYTICGLLAGICGVLYAIDSGSISPSSAGSYFELYAIAAAVLGGCSLRGGEGSILGVIVGTILMQTLNNMIVLLEIPNTFEQINLGSVILIAVIADEVVRRYFNRKGSGKTNLEAS